MKIALAAAAGAAALALAGAASAQQAFIGVLEHDVGFLGEALGVGAADKEDGQDIHFGVRSQRIEELSFLGRPRAYAFAAVNTAGDTNHAGVGLAWTLDFGPERRFYFQPGIGVAYQDGYDEFPRFDEPGLTPAELQRRIRLREDRIEFGSHILLEPELTLGYRFTPELAGELAYTHLSHSGLGGDRNEGMDSVGARLVYTFGR